jgi:hypothetical protein
MGLQMIYFKNCERSEQKWPFLISSKVGSNRLILTPSSVMIWTCKNHDSRVHNY